MNCVAVILHLGTQHIVDIVVIDCALNHALNDGMSRSSCDNSWNCPWVFHVNHIWITWFVHGAFRTGDGGQTKLLLYAMPPYTAGSARTWITSMLFRWLRWICSFKEFRTNLQHLVTFHCSNLQQSTACFMMLHVFLGCAGRDFTDFFAHGYGFVPCPTWSWCLAATPFTASKCRDCIGFPHLSTYFFFPHFWLPLFDVVCCCTLSWHCMRMSGI